MAENYSAMKVLHHKDWLDSLSKGNQPYPVSLRLVLSDFCNHNCSFCVFRLDGENSNQLFGVTDVKTGKRNNNPNRMLDTEKVFEIIDDCKTMGIKSIEFTGGGEPTAQPDHVKIFQKVVDSEIDFALISNGSIFKDGLIDTLVSGASWCRFSIDAGSAKTYSFIREVSSSTFKKVQKNITNLAKARNDQNSELYIGTSFIVTDNNHKELYDAIKICSQLGVDSFRVGYYRSEDGYIHPAYHQQILDDIQRGMSDFGRPDFEIIDRYDQTSENISEGRPTYSYCGYQELNTWIAADYNLYRCCVTAYNSHGYIGSIKNQSFKTLWESDQKKRAISSFDAKSCDLCIYNDKNKLINYLLEDDPRHINFM